MKNAAFAPLGLGLALALVAPAAPAQPGGRPGGGLPPGANPHGGPPGTDCALTALDIVVRPRRVDTLVDIAARVRADKGGQCLFRAEGPQLSTAKGGLVTRPVGELWLDDAILRPLAIGDAPGGDRLRPWAIPLPAHVEHVLVARQYIEGDIGPGGEVDAPARLRTEIRNLGPHVYEGAPVTIRVIFPSGTKGKVTFHSGNPKTAPSSHTPDAEGVVLITDKLSLDDLAPTIDWKMEGDLPPRVAPNAPGGGIGLLEYLRDGLLRDFAEQLTAAGKDDKKIEAAWDRAIDFAYSATKARDTIVAAMGVRALAYFASGLSAAATGVKADGELGDGVVVPAKVAGEVSKVAPAFLTATGQKVAPSPIGSRSARALLPRLEGPTRKKEAQEALKRLAKRIEKNEVVAVTIGDVFTAAPVLPKVGPGVPATAKVIVWGPSGPQFYKPIVVASHHPQKRPMISRAIHALTGFYHRKMILKTLALAALVTGVALGVAALMRRERKAGDGEEGDEAGRASTI